MEYPHTSSALIHGSFFSEAAPPALVLSLVKSAILSNDDLLGWLGMDDSGC